jgi:copper homeostasis protein
MTRPLIEICVEGVDGAVAAAAGGADRIELCASLLEGGLTPSLGTVRATIAAVSTPVNVMIRPRGGDFLYSARDFETMLTDAEAMHDEGVSGIVFGCLVADGTVDEARTRQMVDAARPLSVTFHRAFDMTRDPEAALAALIRCGVDRVLTSGQRPSAIEGAELLRALVRQAGNRIVVMACGQIRRETIARVWRETGARELHFSAPMEQPSPMEYRNEAVVMGGPDSREYWRTLTDPELVRATIAALPA